MADANPYKPAPAPYVFWVDDPRAPKVGRFDCSLAGEGLTAALEENWRGYDSFTPDKKAKVLAWVEAVLEERPDFLEARVALAKMTLESDPEEAAVILDEALFQAGELIPKGFKGTIPWGYLENRFFHRMLFLRMSLAHGTWNLARSLELCRLMLRYDPADNMGVRQVEPLLLLSSGDPEGALTALSQKPLFQDNLTVVGMTRAFAFYANGAYEAFQRQFVLALFSLPWLRLYLEGIDAAPLAYGDDGFRGEIPDLEAFEEFADSPLNVVPGLRDACLELLAAPAVLFAENELRKRWTSLRTSTPRSEYPAKVREYFALEAQFLQEMFPDARLTLDMGRVIAISPD